MENRKSFWNDACLYGTIIGLVCGAITLLGAFMMNEQLRVPIWISLLNKVAFVVLLYFFARRRSSMFGAAEGFSFGQCLAFIMGMMVFAGAVEGIVNFVVNNFIVKDTLEEVMQTALAGMQDQLAAIPNGEDMVMKVYRALMFSPLGCVFTGILGDCLSGFFCGLVISAFVSRTPDMSAGMKQEGNE